MAHSDATVRRRLVGRVGIRGLLAGTTGLVLATMLLGVGTKGAGAGLACQARWPVCDGGFLNLFPQSYPSFFEWIHRVVAGVTGFAILGSALAAWRSDVDSRVLAAVVVGLVLLPVQVILGRQTVVQFTVPILTLHFWTAFTIFSAFVTATALAWKETLTPGRLRTFALTAGVLVPLQIVLHPPFVTGYTEVVQTFAYVVTLGIYAAVLTAVIVGRHWLSGPLRYALVGLVIAEPALVLAGRHLFTPSTVVLGAYLALAAAVGGTLLAAGSRFGRAA